MKPVIKKQTHYNVLLMRDDREARTFRMHSTMLRFLILFFVLLVLLGALGIAGGVHFWRQYHSLVTRSGEQDREMAEMRLQLERLTNLECLIVASNGTMPQAQNQEVGANPPPERTLGAFLAGRNASSPTANATLNAALSANATSAPAGSAQSPADSATSTPAGSAQSPADATETPQASAGGEQTRSRLPAISSPESPVRINRFAARPYNQQRLRISYELSTANPEDQLTISGGARYMAVFANGTRAELALNDTEGTRFSILRMKPMQSTARIPQGHNMDDIQSVDVLIDIADGKEYQENFPIMR